MQVARWGNSLAIRIPSAVAKDLDLKEGDSFSLATNADRAIVVSVPATRRALLEGLRKFRGSFPVDYKFDREEANSRGADPE